MNLILASSSLYRKELIAKLGIKFECISPDVNEDELKQKLLQENTPAREIAETLSYEKARNIADRRKVPGEIIIAGDQLVSFKNSILGKPHNFEKAVEQLQQLKNQTHELITAMTLITEGNTLKYTQLTKLKMKNLTDREIRHYLEKDKPFDCAGSYKIEKNGITLFESIDCDDFSAIQGIPMIWLSNRLKEYGYEFFNY